ncbi:MAG TPA: hypothetical protein VFJ16_24780 [Longimicrobium sp.]|nr:hypothetical protein [Longimicrobium sp.]
MTDKQGTTGSTRALAALARAVRQHGRDVAFATGMALVIRGGGMAWPPLAYLVPGALLLFISIRGR